MDKSFLKPLGIVENWNDGRKMGINFLIMF
jgi:hypothetical protein